jgi:hypothetical protein
MPRSARVDSTAVNASWSPGAEPATKVKVPGDLDIDHAVRTDLIAIVSKSICDVLMSRKLEKSITTSSARWITTESAFSLGKFYHPICVRRSRPPDSNQLFWCAARESNCQEERRQSATPPGQWDSLSSAISRSK